jgi:hypothetical protein
VIPSLRTAITTLLLLCLAGCGGSYGSGPSNVHAVEYRVSGTTSSAAMTYSNATEGTEQVTSNLPWSSRILTCGAPPRTMTAG